jgi:hypothetical protein
MRGLTKQRNVDTTVDAARLEARATQRKKMVWVVSEVQDEWAF